MSLPGLNKADLLDELQEEKSNTRKKMLVILFFVKFFFLLLFQLIWQVSSIKLLKCQSDGALLTARLQVAELKLNLSIFKNTKFND